MLRFSDVSMVLESSVSVGTWEINRASLHSDELWKIQMRDAL